MDVLDKRRRDPEYPWMLPYPHVPFDPVDEWLDRFPWLLAGITGEGTGDEPFDLRLFGDTPPLGAMPRWQAVLDASGLHAVAHAEQVHGVRVVAHRTDRVGVHLETLAADGHATDRAGLLLAVTVADCVPVYLVDPQRRAVALLHAGWRSTAAGILSRGMAALAAYGSAPSGVEMHLGPAICGRCYEVGPEVFEALGLPVPSAPEPVDVRAVLVGQARSLGFAEHHITVSQRCTLCGPRGLFSHRGGRGERQAALLGIRP